MSEPHDLFQLAGTALEGRFRVERAIAEGGFGVVYRAQQEALDRPVAVKVLKTPPRFDDVAKQQFLANFAAEAKTIARITHPNIVQVHDFGVSTMPSGERAAWMVLEWLTGVTLDDELAQRRGQRGRSPAECLDVLRPALNWSGAPSPGVISCRSSSRMGSPLAMMAVLQRSRLTTRASTGTSASA